MNNQFFVYLLRLGKRHFCKSFELFEIQAKIAIDLKSD